MYDKAEKTCMVWLYTSCCCKRKGAACHLSYCEPGRLANLTCYVEPCTYIRLMCCTTHVSHNHAINPRPVFCCLLASQTCFQSVWPSQPCLSALAGMHLRQPLDPASFANWPRCLLHELQQSLCLCSPVVQAEVSCRRTRLLTLWEAACQLQCLLAILTGFCYIASCRLGRTVLHQICSAFTAQARHC